MDINLLRSWMGRRVRVFFDSNGRQLCYHGTIVSVLSDGVLISDEQHGESYISAATITSAQVIDDGRNGA